MSRLRHTAHVLTSRMSTPALGWSRLGASKMARLREWSYNKRKLRWLPLERLITLIYINEVKIDAKKTL